MKRIAIAILVILSALTYPAKAQAPVVFAYTLTKNNPDEWVLVVTRNAAEIVRIEVAKFPNKQEIPLAKSLATLVANTLSEQAGVQLKYDIRNDAEAGLK